MILALFCLALGCLGAPSPADPAPPAPPADAPPGALAVVVEVDGKARQTCFVRNETWTCPATTEHAFPGPPDPRGEGLLLVYAIDHSDGAHEEWLAFWSGERAVWRTPPLLRARAPAWAPDGAWIAFEGGENELPSLYTVQRSGVDTKAVHTDAHGLFEPSVAADGRILHGASRDGNVELFAFAGAAAARLTTDPADDYAPVSSPIGGQIAFLSTRGGLLRVWLADEAGANPRPLANNAGGQRAFAWAPDGARIAVVGEDGGLAVYRVTDGTRTARVALPGPAAHPAWSADASWLAVTVETPAGASVWRGRASGRAWARLEGAPAGGQAWLPRWLP